MCRSRGHIVNAFGEEAALSSIIRMYSIVLSHSIGRYYIAKQVKEKAGTDAPSSSCGWWLDWALASRFAAAGMHGVGAAA